MLSGYRWLHPILVTRLGYSFPKSQPIRVLGSLEAANLRQGQLRDTIRRDG